MSSKSRGYSLIELMTVVAIIGMIILVTIPAFGNLRRRAALRAASAELRTIFRHTRSRAVARAQHSGMKFTQVGGVWYFAVYDDGDRDGVRNDDIARGVDRLIDPPRAVLTASSQVTIGLLDVSIKDPDGDPLPPYKSPVAFNRSAICSFSPTGESTPGTIYITDRLRDIWAVRVYGATGKVTVMAYDRGRRRWTS